MLRVLTDPGFRADPDKLAGVLLAEWSSWDIPGDALGPALLEGNENLRKRPPGTTIWFSPSGLSSYPWYHHNSTPMFSVWLLLAALRDDVALPREAREARARSGRSVRHPGRAGPRALEKGGAASVRRGMAGGTNAYGQTARKGRGRLEQPLWRKPDAIRFWAARRTEAGPDAGEPLVCVASVLGHVDEATGNACPHDAGVRGEAGPPGRKRQVPGRGRPAFRRVR